MAKIKDKLEITMQVKVSFISLFKLWILGKIKTHENEKPKVRRWPSMGYCN